jgi:hypothetical protein
LSTARSQLPSREEVESALLVCELSERRIGVKRQVFELVRDAILLATTVALAIVTILCALHGAAWPLPAGTGGLAAVGLRAMTDGHHRRTGSDQR